MLLIIQLLSLFLSFENAHVVEGGLPNTLAGLPLPAQTQVAVSYVRRDNAINFSAGVALDTLLSPEAFMVQMERGLKQSGWKQVRIPPPSLAPLLFAPTDLPSPETELAATPFFTKRGLTLTLESPTVRPGHLTRAFFRVKRGGVPPEALPPETNGLLFDLFPLLTVPGGAKLGAIAAIGGDDYVKGSTAVTTELSPAQLAEHFSSQLEASGWRVTERHSQKEAAFVVLERSDGEQTYDAQLEIFRPAGQTYSNVELEATLRSSD